MSACVVAAANDSPEFAKFKREMMPKVGQKITVVGTLRVGQRGFRLAFNNWGASIYAAKESGLAKEKDLYAHFRAGQTVKVTGILRYRPEPVPKKKDGQYMQMPPETFFFDVDEAEISLWPPPAAKNPEK